MTQTAKTRQLASCHCCGLIQILPPTPAGFIALCRRCRRKLAHVSPSRNRWTSALALAALALWLPAMLLPLLRIERLGFLREDSLLAGIGVLFIEGYWLVGLVVLLFSVLLPPLKLIVLWLLASTSMVARYHHRATLYRAVELLGRWGMLDVMLVAILIAFVKLGDLVSIQAGLGLLAFTLMVVLSLLASLAFNPALLWDDYENG